MYRKQIHTKAKRTALLLAALLLLASMPLLNGCGEETETGDEIANLVIDMPALADKLLEGVPFQDQMSEVDSEVFYMLYDLTEEDADDAVLITSTGATAEEIAVIHAASEDKIQTVLDAVNARVQAQRDGFEDYVPKELEKLEKPAVLNIGNYVVLCVCDDTEKAKTIVQESITEE